MNLKLFKELVSAPDSPLSPGILKYLTGHSDPAAIRKKHDLLKKMPAIPEKLVTKFQKAVKSEMDMWELKLKPDLAPATLDEVHSMSENRIVIKPEDFKKYYDTLLNTEESPVLKIQYKSADGKSFIPLEIYGRDADMERRRESVDVSRSEVVDYDLIAAASYFRVSSDLEISVPKAIAIGTAAGQIISFISRFINVSLEQQFTDFF